MSIRAALILGLVTASPVWAERPLSAIDWLEGTTVPVPAPAPVIIEPPVTQSATVPQVNVTPLDAEAPVVLGLLPGRVTGLPATLWSGSTAADVITLFDALDLSAHAALQTLLYSVLLAEAGPTLTDADAFLLARVDQLTQLGAVEPAHALIERAGVDTPDRFARWFALSQLLDQGTEACRFLDGAPHLSQDFATRIFCTARLGDWPRAVTLLNAAEAFGDLNADEATLLAHFLDPELAETEDLGAIPDPLSPLDFRLLQALGAPVPTSTLPRAFATVDLSGDAGWRAQLEAAERLARTGAISENRFLGIYTDRLRSASGGIWDRVEAFQRFDTAIASGDPGAVSKALPRVWGHMTSAGLAVVFANIYGSRLIPLPLSEAAKEVAAEVTLLSPDYELSAGKLPPSMRNSAVLAAVATGQAPQITDDMSATAKAIAEGFTPLPDQPDLRAALETNRLGEAILSALALFARGAEGNPGMLTAALHQLRGLGLEDTARRAALHLLVLNPEA